MLAGHASGAGTLHCLLACCTIERRRKTSVWQPPPSPPWLSISAVNYLTEVSISCSVVLWLPFINFNETGNYHLICQPFSRQLSSTIKYLQDCLPLTQLRLTTMLNYFPAAAPSCTLIQCCNSESKWEPWKFKMASQNLIFIRKMKTKQTYTLIINSNKN